jgi:hypothetical protein
MSNEYDDSNEFDESNEYDDSNELTTKEKRVAVKLEELLAENKKFYHDDSVICQIIYNLTKQQDVLKQKINDNKLKLFTICPHEWKMEPPQYQERTWYTCLICRNTK